MTETSKKLYLNFPTKPPETFRSPLPPMHSTNNLNTPDELYINLILIVDNNIIYNKGQGDHELTKIATNIRRARP